MDQINILKTIQLPESITGTIKDKFDAIDSNFNALGSSTYTAGKDGVTRVHTFKFNKGQVENRAEFEEWLTSQLGISNPKEVVDSIVNAFANYKKNDDWYANGSYEIYIGTDEKIKEALPILYANDKTISYLGFEYENDVLILKSKKDVLGIDGEGYWVINGIKTDIKAEGVAGENGKDGTAIEFGFVTVEPVEFSGSILKILQYWDYTIPNNTPISFDKDLDAKGKDDWFDKNKNRVFLFTHEIKTYMGYVTKYTHDYNSNIPESEPIYGFYYSDATMYSPGAGGSGVSGLITALDNMVYNQQVGDKPRGIWFKKTEDEKDKEAIFMYNKDNTLNICKIDNYTKAYNTGDIKEESTTVKVNGKFECDGAVINDATIKGDVNINNNLIASSATIYNSLSVDGEMDASTMECDSATITKNLKVNIISSISNDVVINDNLSVGKGGLSIKQPTIVDSDYFAIRKTDNNSNYVVVDTATSEFIKNFPDLGLSNGHKYIQVGGQNDSNEARVTTITPTKITSSDLKLIRDAVVNGYLKVWKDVTIVDNLRVINGDNYAGIYTHTGENDATLELDKYDKYLRVGDLNKDRATTITPTKITSSNLKLIGDAVVNGDMTISGTLHVTSITTDEGVGGDTSTTNFKDLTVTESTNLNDLIVTGSTNLNNLKVINNASNFPSYTYIDSNYFNYPKLIYDVLNKLGIVNSNVSPYKLNIDNNVYQTNYCNLHIKPCNEASFYGYNGSVYSVGVKGSTKNRKGKLYRITGYIMLNDPNSDVLSFDEVTPNVEYGGYNIFNPHDNIAIPQIIYIDDYFAFVNYYNENNSITQAIIAPYGIQDSKFAPHHIKSGSGEIQQYNYNLATIHSTIGGNIDGTSKAKQSVIHTLGNNLQFNLLHNIITII